MASRWLPRSEETQVDPFNAGEPELPWDDLAMTEAEASDEEGPSYAAHGEGPGAGQPHKADDNYRAPTTRERDYDAPSIEDAGAEKPAQSRRRRRSGRAQGTSVAGAPAAPGRPAAARHRGCALMSLVFAIVIALTVIAIVIAVLDSNAGIGSNSVDDTGWGGFVDMPAATGEVDEDEQDGAADARQAFEARMDELLADPASGELHDAVRAQLDERILSSLGYEAADLGVDTDALATWICERATFTVDDAYDNGDGTATVYFEGNAPSTSGVVSALFDEVFDYLSDHQLWGEGTGRPPSDEDRAHVSAALDDLLADDLIGYTYLSAELSWQDGAWVVDEQSLSEALDLAFGIY